MNFIPVKQKFCICIIRNINHAIFFLFLFFFSSIIFSQVTADSLKHAEIINDTTKIKIRKADLTFPDKSVILPNSFQEFYIQKSRLELVDHKTTNDFLINIPFSFTKKLGYTGLPNENILYGSSLSFFDNDIELNNRLTHSYDLNLFQSESIDSIEIIPLSRSFLFRNSPVAAINFILRELVKSKPYSRIKYYQAANDEAFIDGIFSVTPFAKTNVYFEVTNHANGAFYKTTIKSLSDYTNWMGNLRVNYAFSDKINLRFGYKYVNSTIQLYGGIDVDSISNSLALSNREDIIYDNILAPVRYSNRYSNSVINNLTLNLSAKLNSKLFTDLTLYSNNYLLSYRQNYSGIIQNKVIPVSRDNESKATGISIRGDFSDSLLNISGSAVFEHTKFGIDQYSQVYPIDSTRIKYYNGKTINTLSISANASFNLLDNQFIPAGFIKYMRTYENNYIGFGADAVIKIHNDFKVYVGISRFEKPATTFTKNQSTFIAQNILQRINSIEVRTSYTSRMFDLTAGYFFIQNDNDIFYAFDRASYTNDVAYSLFMKQSQISGANISFSLNLLKINLSANTNFYFSENDRVIKGLPTFSINAGAFYLDTLFNNNLKLKAGFNFYSYGSRYQQQIDFENGVTSSYSFDSKAANGFSSVSLISSNRFSPATQVDLFIAGKIQDAATIFFTWENLFNTKYMIVPYYPMQLRNIRFGFSWEFFD